MSKKQKKKHTNKSSKPKRRVDPLRNNPIVGWMSEGQAERILEEIREEKRRGTW